MAAKPLPLLLRQVRERPEHRALAAIVREHVWGCSPETLGLRGAGREHAAWRLAFWSCAGEACLALSALAEMRAENVDPLLERETARRILALFDEALRPRSERAPATAEARARRDWGAELARAAYDISAVANGVPGPAVAPVAAVGPGASSRSPGAPAPSERLDLNREPKSLRSGYAVGWIALLGEAFERSEVSESELGGLAEVELSAILWRASARAHETRKAVELKAPLTLASAAERDEAPDPVMERIESANPLMARVAAPMAALPSPRQAIARAVSTRGRRRRSPSAVSARERDAYRRAPRFYILVGMVGAPSGRARANARNPHKGS